MSPVPGTTTELPFCSIPKNLLTKDSKKEEKEKRRRRKKKERGIKQKKKGEKKSIPNMGPTGTPRALACLGSNLPGMSGDLQM